MRTSDFDFFLPKNLIASRPLEKRDSSRLLVLHKNRKIEHKMFFDVVGYMNKGDMLLLNNTKVFPARILAVRSDNKEIDILFIKEADSSGTWEVMYRGGFRGEIFIRDAIKAEVWIERQASSAKYQTTKKFLRFLDIEPLKAKDIIWQHGYMPLPPYIRRMPDDEDRQTYQTVYAEDEGSIAAPTAGLHFTIDLLNKIEKKGVLVRAITLHVGPGTFKPIKAEFIEGHKMDEEYFEIKSSLIEEMQHVKRSGKRLIAVGTTTTRAIEGFVSGVYYKCNSSNGFIRGYTDIFIRPGYNFKAVDAIITNFHLPKSTPLMLVSALCGFDNVLMAYKDAIVRNYRFFSYGDAMLVI